MRWIAFALSPIIAALCGSIGGNTRIGSDDSRVGAGQIAGPSGGAPVVDCGAPPAGATYLFDADNVDGSSNSTLTNGSFVGTWTNLGSLGATGNATQVSQPHRPVLLTNAISGKPAVAFDGVSDILNIGGSKTSMRGPVSTGKQGHFAIVYRHDGPRGTLSRTIFGNTNTSSTPGIALGYNGQTGGYSFLIGQATTAANALNQVRPVMARQQILQLWADGSSYFYKSNAVAGTQTGSLSGVTALTADTANFMAFGCNGAVTNDCSDGAFAFLAYYPAALSAPNQTALENYLTCKYSF